MPPNGADAFAGAGGMRVVWVPFKSHAAPKFDSNGLVTRPSNAWPGQTAPHRFASHQFASHQFASNKCAPWAAVESTASFKNGQRHSFSAAEGAQLEGILSTTSPWRAMGQMRTRRIRWVSGACHWNLALAEVIFHCGLALSWRRRSVATQTECSRHLSRLSGVSGGGQKVLTIS